MQLTGNTGVERIELQGTLPDGAILQEAYKFFVEYRGDVMDDELTYELIKQLWVNGMIDNIELLLPAFAKKQLSDSGGRQVVDKMFDVSLNRRIIEWSGTDRPEFTDFGVSKVCVEAERTNQIYNSDTSTNSFSRAVRDGLEIRHGIAGGLYSVAEGESNPVIYVRPSATGFDFTEGKEYAFSAFVDTANSDFFSMQVSFSGNAASGLVAVFTPSAQSWALSINSPNVIDHHVRDEHIGGGIYRLEAVVILEEDATDLGCWIYFGNNHNVWIGGWQLENAPYATNLIPTSGSTVTRLAPTVPIEDALPLTGTVAGKVDMVRTVGVGQFIWDTGGTLATTRSLMSIQSTNTIRFTIYGSDGGEIIEPFPFDIPDGERFVMEYAGSFDASNVYLFVRVGEDKFLFTSEIVQNNMTETTAFLGSSRTGEAHYSARYLTPWAKTDQVLTTEAEFEALFEVIS